MTFAVLATLLLLAGVNRYMMKNVREEERVLEASMDAMIEDLRDTIEALKSQRS